MTETPEEIFKAMSASTILVSILKTIESVTVPTETFLNSVNSDQELAVSYDEDTQSFSFKLKAQDENQ